MEITNHGRGLALTMGWASMHMCVFCWGFGCAVIDVFCWNLLKDFMLK